MNDAMSSESVVITPLDPSSSLPATIASLQFSLWGLSTGHPSAADYERLLRQANGASALPAVLIARHGRRFIGSVNLLAHEMTTRPHLSPWLAQLLVLEEARRQGVGRMLIEATIARAAALGYPRLHLYTSGTLPTFYQSLGWRPIEMTPYLGKQRTIMVFDLSKHPEADQPRSTESDP
jgi:GNAT superfamily N-acetyltransferase